MQLVDAVNSNHVLRCSVCGDIIMSWSYGYRLNMINSDITISCCRSCVDLQDCDIIKSVLERQVFWTKEYRKPLKSFIIMGGFAATLDQHLAGETKNGSNC